MDLADVMQEVADRLGTIDGLRAYAYPPDNVQVPAAVVTYPEEYRYDETYGRGMDRITLPVMVMVGKVSDRASRDQVGAYVDGSGARSIKAVLEADAAASFLDLPGSVGSYASTPDRSSLDITGPIDVRVDAALDDWTPAGVQCLAAKAISGGNWSWQFAVRPTTGVLRFTWSANGTATIAADSTVAPTVADGARLATRVTFLPDNGASGRTARFWTAPTIAGPWTQLGGDVTTAGVTSLFSGGAMVEIGARNSGTSEPLAGLVYAAEVRSGIDGAIVTAPDFRGLAAGTVGFVDEAGLAWSVQGSGAVVAGAPAPYTAFDSLRAMGAEFDVVSMAGVEYLAAIINLDIAGDGA